MTPFKLLDMISIKWLNMRFFASGLLQMTIGNEDQLPPTTVYGFADAGTAFDQRHPQWKAVMSRLGDVINLAFTRTQVMKTPIDKFVYFYGNLVAEDFM